MTGRQQEILCATVREYIRTGEPVASAALKEQFPWSSATIRSEFHALEHAGYLVRAHYSSGRVPSTTGYRYYVDHAAPQARSSRAASTLERLHRQTPDESFSRDLALALAELSGTLAIVALGILESGTRPPRGRFRVADATVSEAGFGQLFRMQEFDERPTVADVARLLDVFEHPATVFSSLASPAPRAFINGENPLVPTRRVSMVTTATVFPSGEALLAALIGPVRMPYERHLGVLSAFHQVFSPHELSRGLS